MAADLDSNPKIVAGGREAREVYLFVLRRNWAHNADGKIPAADLGVQYVARQLFMSEVEAAIGILRAAEVQLINITRDGEKISIPPGGTDNALQRVVTLVTHADGVEIDGWTPEWGGGNRTNAERQRAYREAKKNKQNETVEEEGSSVTTRCNANERVVTRYTSEKSRSEENKISLVPEDSGTVVGKADRIPDLAWKAADALRALVLEEDPKAAIGRLSWDDNTKTGQRLKWADAFRLIVDRDGRTYDELKATMTWLFRKQTGDARFVVQSPESLRKKWDRIQAQMRRPPTQAVAEKQAADDRGRRARDQAERDRRDIADRDKKAREEREEVQRIAAEAKRKLGVITTEEGNAGSD